MNNLDAGEIISYVQKIIDDVRCPTCDKLESSRLRYSCGHTACEDCVILELGCQICTSPSVLSEAPHRLDQPQTQVVKNASNLLKACQILFGPNAFQYKRLSERLRIEKELFPKCIQAPVKYENKRKSVPIKENSYSTFFPGEAISTAKENKMENSLISVQQWLHKNDENFTRKPFTDLNVNAQMVTSSRKQGVPLNSTKHNTSVSVSRKRSHFKTTFKDLTNISENNKLSCNSPKKVKKKSNTSLTGNNNDCQKKFDNDESGIFMENDPIVIDDSQETFVDKDRNAWLAVLEACKNEQIESTSLVSSSQVNTTNDNNIQLLNSHAFNTEKNYVSRVPFFKKSAIIETCKDCKKDIYSSSVSDANQANPVKITIDSDSFLTTITVFKNVQSEVNTRSCVSIQTENDVKHDLVNVNNCNEINASNQRHVSLSDSVAASDTYSEDLFADDQKIFGDCYQKTETSKCLVIEESDSDTDLDASGPMSVKAVVHRSCEDIDYGILTDVVDMTKHENRPRHGPRGHTPASTDSSEKENYHPNRIKKRNSGKKKDKNK